MTVNKLFFGYGCSVPAKKIVKFIHNNFKPEKYSKIMTTHPNTDPTTFCYRKKVYDNLGLRPHLNTWKILETYNISCIDQVLTKLLDHKYISIYKYNNHTDELYTHMFVGYIKSVHFDYTCDNNPYIISDTIMEKVKSFLLQFILPQFSPEKLQFKQWSEHCNHCYYYH